ncbi:hypothetical protein NOR_05991 [Metarhizium rileyi]|uniref:F-box domain-containing protein n=1 Tax=Metarhizium rileyi (strain RCEF 4871) TaxID=1649241 RepID=A0A167BFU2_METRR|nr:hypothetical protein NOR_05991 [Metarhizium rileyi RCEF 4871]TWU72256.1 hypothetical protein ED733_001546 [Metarhizium rileyi]
MSPCVTKPTTSFSTTNFIVPRSILDQDALITGPLLRLPPEVTLQILEEAENDVDRLCLGLACRRLLHIVRQRGIQLPCLRDSRRVRNIHHDNKLAFSMMKRVYPLSPNGSPRADAALCESCFKWINTNHYLTISQHQPRIVFSEVVPYLNTDTLKIGGVFFDCAKCVASDPTPNGEKIRRLEIYKLLAASETVRFGSVAVWVSRVNMHNGSEVDP